MAPKRGVRIPTLAFEGPRGCLGEPRGGPDKARRAPWECRGTEGPQGVPGSPRGVLGGPSRISGGVSGGPLGRRQGPTISPTYCVLLHFDDWGPRRWPHRHLENGRKDGGGRKQLGSQRGQNVHVRGSFWGPNMNAKSTRAL